MTGLALALFGLTAAGALTLIAVTLALIGKATGMTADQRVQSLERPGEEVLAALPKVTVVVPARNEERNVEPCLRSLFAADYPNLEILLVDDESTDGTVEAARRVLAELDPNGERARLIDLAEVARGDRSDFACGKSYVLAEAARHATGDWLLFADADVRHRADALWRSMLLVRELGLKAYSASGVYPNPGFWGEVMEGTLYVVVFFAIPLRAVNDLACRHLGWANGQYILCERATYERIGGHTAVAPFSQDDLALGRLFKEWEVPFRFLPGAQLYTCVNYVSLAEAHHGWRRQIAAGTPWLGRGRPFFAAVFAALLLTALLPVVAAALAYGGVVPNVVVAGVSLKGLALGQLIGGVVFQALNRLSMKVPVWRAVLAPVGALLCCRTLVAGYRDRFAAGVAVFRDRELAMDDPDEITRRVAAARADEGGGD